MGRDFRPCESILWLIASNKESCQGKASEFTTIEISPYVMVFYDKNHVMIDSKEEVDFKQFLAKYYPYVFVTSPYCFETLIMKELKEADNFGKINVYAKLSELELILRELTLKAVSDRVYPDETSKADLLYDYCKKCGYTEDLFLDAYIKYSLGLFDRDFYYNGLNLEGFKRELKQLNPFATTESREVTSEKLLYNIYLIRVERERLPNIVSHFWRYQHSDHKSFRDHLIATGHSFSKNQFKRKQIYMPHFLSDSLPYMPDVTFDHYYGLPLSEVLRDNSSGYGGISNPNETLLDFLCETETDMKDIDEINNALASCGIERIKSNPKKTGHSFSEHDR